MNDLRRPKILIVDDTQTNIDILMEALREDYRVGEHKKVGCAMLQFFSPCHL